MLRERARQHGRQREETSLCGFERVDILDGVVEIAIVGEREPVLPARLDQDADEREQKVEVIFVGGRRRTD